VSPPRAYYNEHDDFPAQWLENLIAAGLIAPGIVDRRSIVDVRASDLKGFTQCHFFAGIGGWSHALRLIGWRDRHQAWTISCPCQPWSKAGTVGADEHERGENDDRDLWPTTLELIKECKPSAIFGEQVCGGIAKRWMDRTLRDLKNAEYDFHAERRRTSDYGSPQIRERFYFSSYLDGERGKRLVPSAAFSKGRPWRWRGEEDLQSIVRTPFEPGRCWPAPLVRKGNILLSSRVGQLRAYGNSIDPWVVAQFIQDTNRKASIF
jgi:DNA (cytosine-5)-methyltransferase 1